MKTLVSEGFSVKEACFGVGISRSRYYELLKEQSSNNKTSRRKKEDEAEIVKKIEAIKIEHPFWGYRRVWAWLQHREGIKMNPKRVYRIMKEAGLLGEVKRCKAKRTSGRSKPRANRPRQYWGIDMTKFWIENFGWAYLVVVMDWYTKEIVGFDVSMRSRTEEWLSALEQGLNKKFPEGVRGKGLCLVSDNGSQPTSKKFVSEMKNLQIKQILTSYSNPKGNAETERMIRTIKEELIWISEFRNLIEAKDRIGDWIRRYNREYVHSALSYMSPEKFEARYYEGRYREAA